MAAALWLLLLSYTPAQRLQLQVRPRTVAALQRWRQPFCLSADPENVRGRESSSSDQQQVDGGKAVALDLTEQDADMIKMSDLGHNMTGNNQKEHARPLFGALRRSRPASQQSSLKYTELSAANSSRPGGMVWANFRRRFRKRKDEAELNRTEPLIDMELIEAVAEDVDAAFATRRRRLNLRLARSLQTFKEEVLDEVSMQEQAVRDRQERLAKRQKEIFESLAGLRGDIMEDIETLLGQVLRLCKVPVSCMRHLCERSKAMATDPIHATH
eukprot:6192256-Pleurochrysis_carterae.AAC.4